jgi:HSP20 family protein
MAHPIRVTEDAFDKLSRQVDAMMDELTGHTLYRLVSSDAWEPRVNIYEHRDCFWVCVDLAGMQHDKIDVYAKGGRLFISGVRSQPDPPKGGGTPSVHVMEIDWGRFERSIEIPSSVVETDSTAVYRNGYLWVALPKTQP